ncbi:MAG: nucleotide exchange factor GrpE [Lachnospiraceae bacterium]|nr:nucleotide exchange factor GrpE [Lachnospiraceae bacterium]MBR3508576.1 nucleotide exchange factor GrpE [Lachnospiraceae bacterium]MBR4608330.1 nucleotide exchange factor GrpE [Lachnospiraceae bacterium]MBR6152604.1 nucleotide exchange factor GrpE [Lachnospiraceae bacterium]
MAELDNEKMKAQASAEEPDAETSKAKETEASEEAVAEAEAVQKAEEVTEEAAENAEDEADEDEAIEEADEEAAEDAEEGKGEGKKSWAERRAEKKQAKQKADAMKEQIDQLEDKVKRQLAEFENFRNRTEREKQAMFETGARSVIEKILPVVDNFERGLATVGPDQQEDPFVDGMNKVYRQLVTELENIGVKPIEAVGKEFDPNLHNAVMQVESEEYESGIVAQELQKGYTYRDVVVRHSMVSVVQ